MEWHFSIAWFLVGIITIALGALTVIYYNKVADAFFDGVKNYGKTKLGGLIAIGVGLIFMTNTHIVLLTWFVNFLLGK